MIHTCCPICRASEITLFYNKADRELMICAQCRHVFWREFPDQVTLSQYYTTDYTSIHEQHQVQTTLADYYRAHAKELSDLANVPIKTLAIADVGCSYPAFLEQVTLAGCTTAIGVDWSLEAREYGLQRNIAVVTPVEMEAMVPNGLLDVLRYSHTLEHMLDPLAELRSLVTKVRPGGLVYITQPNIPVMRFELSAVEPHDAVWPTHLHLFSPLSLTCLLNAVGLSIERIFSVSDPEQMQKRYSDQFDIDFAREALRPLKDKGEAGRGEYNNYPYFFGSNSAVYARRPSDHIDISFGGKIARIKFAAQLESHLSTA